MLGGPWIGAKAEPAVTRHRRLFPLQSAVNARRHDGHARTIDMKARQTVQAFANDGFVAPTRERVGGGGIPEVVLVGSIVEKMRRMSGIDADRPAQSSRYSFERTLGDRLKLLLPKHDPP